MGLREFILEKQGNIPPKLDKYIKELALYDKLYLYSLYQKFWQKEKILKIGKNFIPSAFLKETERARELGVVNYSEIKGDGSLADFAKQAVLVCTPMDGGLGTSLRRIDYLRQIWKEIKKQGEPHLGAKGTDLYFDITAEGTDAEGNKIEFPEKLSITEIKYLQLIKNSAFYNKIIVEELVNEESTASINYFLDKVINFLQRVDKQTEKKKLTYRELISRQEKIQLAGGMITQFSLPTIEKDSNKLTVDRLAPGGHGQLGSMVLSEAAQEDTALPENLIRVIYNGDGPNNFPDKLIVGFMAKGRIPIVMITAVKTPLDRKGGQIGLELRQDEKEKPQILELAQAENAGQRDLFKNIGLRGFDRSLYGEAGKQYFNTNIVLINYTVLSPFLKELRKLIGAKEFSQAISPNLIKNEKSQNKKKYIQLEGALASTLFNLNGFIKTCRDKRVKNLIKKHNMEKFLVIINLDMKERSNFFTPVKFAWDFWLYAYSDHFRINKETFKLENLKPGHLPDFNLGYFYQDLKNCIDSFGKASTIDLDSLTIKGEVLLKDAKLSGKVIIENNSQEAVDLNSRLFAGSFGYKKARLFLKDIKIRITEAGKIEKKSTA